MSVPAELERMIGDWSGTSRLFRPWHTLPEEDSASTATVARAAGGRFVTVAYTWSVDEAAQEGLLLIGQDAKQDMLHAAWADSWHMGDGLMTCRRDAADDGLAVRGSYAAPPGPDWGWRIVLHAPTADAFTLSMVNISPDGEETPAVEARYTRMS